MKIMNRCNFNPESKMLMLFFLSAASFVNVEACFYYPPTLDFKKLGLLGDTFKYKNYWTLPKVKLEDAEEEAIMLIGGK